MTLSISTRRAPSTAENRGCHVWLVGSDPALDTVACQLSSKQTSVAARVSLDDTLASATPGDWVLLGELTSARIVEAAEALLARRVHTVLVGTNQRALYQALGSRVRKVDCVVLSPEPPSPVEVILLRLRDVLCAGLALVVLAPLIGGLALAVKLSSPGPAFFTAQVIGRNAQVFTWRKLRTMRNGTLEDESRRREQYRALVAGQESVTPGSSAPRKIVDETRVTGIGRLLRRHSLDELPQLWNVLTGEMTLVGARPCFPYEYQSQPPWQRLRYRVTPGLTGPWQAYGRSQVTFDEMVLMDYCYSRMRSFWLDARLILRTVRVVITGEGGK